MTGITDTTTRDTTMSDISLNRPDAEAIEQHSATTYETIREVRCTPEEAEERFDIYGDYESNELIILVNPLNQGLAYIEVMEDGKFYTIAERSEIISEDLEEVKQWLWDNWIKYEV